MKLIYLSTNMKQSPIRGVVFNVQVGKDVYCDLQYLKDE